MSIIYGLLWYLHDELPASSHYSGAFKKVFKILGYTIGLLLDLYSNKAKKKEIKEYAHVIKIIQRLDKCDEQSAIALFYQYEDELEKEFNRLEANHPAEVRYFRSLQSETIRYCNENRKIRYLKEHEADGNLSPGQSIL